MRFFCYTLGEETEPQPMPSPDAMAEMGRFVEESIKSGVLIATGGMAPTAEGVKVSYTNGQFTTTDGPFAEAKELVGGWALIEVPSKEAAIEQTKRFLRLVGGGDITVRQVFGPED